MQIQLIPARGRKRLPGRDRRADRRRIQLIPARGRKHQPLDLIDRRLEFNSSPQGDGNLGWTGRLADDPVNSTHPRKGTETSPRWVSISNPLNSTHPRKGTETSRSRAASWSIIIQLIPARGRKLLTRNSDIDWMINSTHPRKGTETQIERENAVLRKNSTHPRKGTETARIVSN